MHTYRHVFFISVILLCLALPVAGEVVPLWIEPATVGGELSGVVISADGSTILSGGDQLISLTRDGRKRWSGWSGTSLDISSQGDYILSSKGTVVRLLSGAGTLIWEKNMEIAVTDVSLAPDLSMIAAAGGGKARTLTFAGEGIASNDTMTINRIGVLPPGKQIILTTSRDVQLVGPDLMPEWADRNSSQNLLAIAPDGSRFVTATSNRIRMYTGNGSLLWDNRFPIGDAEALAWSRDGSTIVVALDENILVLDRAGGQVWKANATNYVNSVAVSNDGNTIAAASLDKTLRVFNHAGTSIGTFSVKNAIKPGSVAVTGDGQLIVLVAQSAVYGFSRTSFTDEAEPVATITDTATGTPDEMTTTAPAVTTTRKVTTRTPTIPTPYPSDTATPESALSPAVPLAAVLLLYIAIRCGRK
jgi:WD40 repeat protein